MMVNYKINSPWIVWYTLKPTIAPLLFEYDKWWEKWWLKWWWSNWKTKCNMLVESYKSLNRPIYIWLTKVRASDWNFYRENLKWWYCFKKTKISWKWYTLYKIDFNNN